MAMQAGKIQLVHYSAAREYGLKPGHAQLTRFFRDQIDAALFDGCDAQPEIWNGFQRLCLADDVESKVTLPDVRASAAPSPLAVSDRRNVVPSFTRIPGRRVMGGSERRGEGKGWAVRVSFGWPRDLKKKKIKK